MAESHKFGKDGLVGAVEVFPDLKWRKTRGGSDLVHDEKAGGWVPVKEGQYIVKIGSRYEVADEEPEKAKKATAPKSAAKQAKVEEAKATLEGTEPEDTDAAEVKMVEDKPKSESEDKDDK